MGNKDGSSTTTIKNKDANGTVTGSTETKTEKKTVTKQVKVGNTTKNVTTTVETTTVVSKDKDGKTTGSTVTIKDKSGKILSTVSYDASGKVIPAGGNSSNTTAPSQLSAGVQSKMSLFVLPVALYAML